MAHNNEASVEEILESIKKVIARDNSAEVRRSDDRVADTRGRDVSQECDDEAEEVLELSNALDEACEHNGRKTVGADMSDDNDDPDGEPPLLGKDAQGAMMENLAALAMLAEPGARPQIVRSGETSLEGLTRELLRPMLAEWLEKNLPGMVEKMVQAEIARIAGKRR
jgi:cell pole-organizing protein PopZ